MTPRLVPLWLRPLAATAVIGLHAGVLVGVGWPEADTPAVTAPIAVAVVPQGAAAAAYEAPREAQIAEITAMTAAASAAQAAEVAAAESVKVETVESAETPRERPREVRPAEALPLVPQASLRADDMPSAAAEAIPEPPPRPKPRVAERKRRGTHRTPSPAQAASRASAVAQAEAVTGAIASATYRSVVAAELNRRKFYPPSARAAGLEGVVVMTFTVGGDGRLRDHAIVRPSGEPMLDRAAQQMMAAIALPPPPGGVFRATVPIRYSIRD